jgi:hypothetical protein
LAHKRRALRGARRKAEEENAERPTSNAECRTPEGVGTTVAQENVASSFLRSIFGVGRSVFSSSSRPAFSPNEIESPLRRITMSGSGPNGKKQCLE